MRIGHGYDAHRMGDNRKMVIGGVTIPYSKGLIAHSDGDVLIHAIIDALFGAAGEKDIGSHFPDTDMKYKDCNSRDLLKETAKIIENKKFKVDYVDATIIAQEPKMKKYIDDMRANISSDLGIDVSRVNVKATTEEKMGFTGSLEGIAAHAVCILSE